MSWPERKQKTLLKTFHNYGKRTFKSNFALPLLTEISKNGENMEIPTGTEVLREGQYVKVISIVIFGLIFLHQDI